MEPNDFQSDGWRAVTALTPEERSLLVHLMRKAELPCPDDAWLDGLLTVPVGPGRSSFILVREAERDYDQLVSDVQFPDADGVPVLASLFIDRERVPYEVEIWKADDTPLIRLPMFPEQIEVSSELKENASLGDYRRLSLFLFALGFFAAGAFAWVMGLLAGLQVFGAVSLIGQGGLVWIYRRELMRGWRTRGGRL